MRRFALYSLTTIVSIASVSLLSGCPDREVAEVTPAQNKQNFKEIPVKLERDVDLLFVIDNSGSMGQEQASLAANFNGFINVLQNIEGGLPNVHIGVVSTDTGVGPFPGTGCSATGDNGSLRSNAACGIQNAYIVDVESANGRDQNYTGNLADVFSCAAQLGINGCGFESPLESMYLALNGSNPTNSNFLRDDAFLAVIFLTDEDDCSASDNNMFDTSQNDINAPLGPLSSFRCFEFGVRCTPDDPRTPGQRADCESREDSQYLQPVSRYIDFLRNLKDDPNKVIVAGIIGNPSPVVVGADANNNNIPKLQPSCMSASGEASPAVRLNQFLDAFPQRTSVTTICNEDLSDALVVIAELLKKVIGNPCLEGDLDIDPSQPGVQYECQVADVRYPDTDMESSSSIPHCDDSAPPCWRLQENPSQCSETLTNLELIIDRGGNDNVPDGTFIQASCVTK